ncbi:MAG: hypothetical protein IKL84_04785 [Clostridia bacterium]|nr:hypothetical protein [Clostridia bacterium]
MHKVRLAADIRVMLRCLVGAALALLATLPVLSAASSPKTTDMQLTLYDAEFDDVSYAALPCGLADDLQLELLARVIAAEAGGMSYIEQTAYGAMLKNRTADPRFPHELGQVIGSAELRIAEGEIPSRALRAARSASFGIDPTGGALYCFPITDTAARTLFGERITAEFEHLFFAK